MRGIPPEPESAIMRLINKVRAGFSDFNAAIVRRTKKDINNMNDRSFDQIKEIFLNDATPHYNNLTMHFESLENTLVKEIKEFKTIFNELEEEYACSADKLCRLEKENLELKTDNDDLLVKCLNVDL